MRLRRKLLRWGIWNKRFILLLHSITWSQIKLLRNNSLWFEEYFLGPVELFVAVFCILEQTKGMVIFLSEWYFMEEREGLVIFAFSELASIMHFNSHCISLTVMPYLCEWQRPLVEQPLQFITLIKVTINMSKSKFSNDIINMVFCIPWIFPVSLQHKVPDSTRRWRVFWYQCLNSLKSNLNNLFHPSLPIH